MVKKYLKNIVSHFGFEIRRKDILETHYQVDPYFNNLYEKAQQSTQMTSTDNALRQQRHYVLNYLLLNVDFSKGDVCEAGCWRGLSAYQIASYIKKKNYFAFTFLTNTFSFFTFFTLLTLLIQL